MTNLALYRRYRPTSFSEVIGQDHVTQPLVTALGSGKLHHAYLFSGPRGCGKTSSARILARSLNCAEGPTPDPCGTCDSCVALSAQGSGSLDVIEIDAASHGGVDDARELRERAFFSPVNARYKIYIIDEAHMVSSAGFNALLKLVEEPPQFVVFVFATTEPEKVLPTIRSRTHHYPFRLVPPLLLGEYIERLCVTEGVKVEPAVFPLVVRAGGGSVRDTLSIMDQLLSGAGEEGVTYQRALGLLGVTDTALLDDACASLAASDGGALFGVVDRVVSSGHDPRRFATDLLERLRDLLILNKVPNASQQGIINVPDDQLEKMAGQALRLGGHSGATLSRMADVLADCITHMRGTTSPRLLLELACARMLLPAVDDSDSGFAQRLERLERRLSIADESTSTVPPQPVVEVVQTPAVVPPPVPAQKSTSIEAPISTPPKEEVVPEKVAPILSPGEVGITDVQRLWPDILERLKTRRVVWSLMQNVTPVSVNGKQLVVAVHHEGLIRRVSDDAVVKLVCQVLHDLLGVQWGLDVEVNSAASLPPSSVTSETNEQPERNTSSFPQEVPDPGQNDNKPDGERKTVTPEEATAVLERVLGATKA